MNVGVPIHVFVLFVAAVTAPCAVPANDVVAWGENSYGETSVPAGLKAIAVAGGHNHSLALKSDGTVVAWGQLGETNVPSDLNNVVAIASGRNHCLALKADGTVVAWGYFYNVGPAFVPEGLSNVVAVAGGRGHSLALRRDGTVVAWGQNHETQGSVPPGVSGIVAIEAGYYFNLVLKDNETVVAWGSNSNGQANVPLGLTNVVAIQAGWLHCLALRRDGTIVEWGRSWANPPAQLGKVTSIAACGHHSVALRIQPRITTLRWSTDHVTIQFPTELGQDYSVEFLAELVSGDWHALPNGFIAGDGQEAVVIDSQAVTDFVRLYRLRLLP